MDYRSVWGAMSMPETVPFDAETGPFGREVETGPTPAVTMSYL